MQSILPDFQESRIKKDHLDNIHEDTRPEDAIKLFTEFNDTFINRFKMSGLPNELLVEFVHSIEHLDNIMEMKGFPTGRMITTPDVVNFGEEAVTALSSLRGFAHGVAVSEDVLNNVQEFFDMKYIKTIHMILEKFKMTGIAFTLDKIEAFVGISYQTNHPRFGILTYRLFNQEDGSPGVHIPFLINRLR